MLGEIEYLQCCRLERSRRLIVFVRTVVFTGSRSSIQAPTACIDLFARVDGTILSSLGRRFRHRCHCVITTFNISVRSRVSFKGLGPVPIYFGDLGIRNVSITATLSVLSTSLRNFHCRKSCLF